MNKQTLAEPLRGAAAYRAHKAEIAKRNESARAHGAARRAAQEAGISERQLETARLERSNLPRQPRP